MDTLAHALWTNAAFYPKYKNKLKDRLWAVFFGVAPDLVSFSPVFGFYFLYRITGLQIVGAWRNWFMQFYSYQSYYYTHSLIIFLTVFIVVMLIRKGKPYWPLLGWLLHICIDIPSHKGFYETPFLFPFSRFTFSHGTSWGHPLFMAINYSALALVYIVIFLYTRRHAKAKP